MKNKYFESLIFAPDKGCSYMEIFLHYFVLRVLGLALLFMCIALYSDFHKDSKSDFIPIAACVLIMGFIINLITYINITFNHIQLKSNAKEKDEPQV